MSKNYNMRWRKSDERELRRVIKNFNQKIDYHTRKNPYADSYLPEKLNFNEVKNSVDTRKDFNRVINSIQRFGRKGAEQKVSSKKGAVATQWEVDEFKIKQRIINTMRTMERKKIEQEKVKIGGKETDSKRSEMGSVKENSLKPSNKNFFNQSQKEWELARDNFDRLLNASARKEKQQQMINNYLAGLAENGFLDANPEIEDYIRALNYETFLKTVETDETATFLFYKEPVAWETRRQYIVSSWETAYNNFKESK